MNLRLVPKCVLRYAESTWQPPFPQALPSNAETFARSHSPLRAARRRFVRAFNFRLHGQGGLLQNRIDLARHRRVLWIHRGMPQVGDSLCDLAARVLLKGEIQRLDLLTDAHLLPLYSQDEVFGTVGGAAAELPGPYDLILLHSASSRSAGVKFESYRELPFVNVQGFYTGPEFNRTLFGFYRIAQLIGSPLSEAALEHMARPSMRSSDEDEAAIDRLRLPGGAIALAVGGVRGWRTYSQWPEVLRGLIAAGLRRPVILIGSDNGLSMRDEIMAADTDLEVIDRVARHSLGETRALLRRSALAVCSDGGLLHVAHTTDTPVVALFAGIIEPKFRVTSGNNTRWLYGAESVDDIAPAEVAACIVASLG